MIDSASGKEWSVRHIVLVVFLGIVGCSASNDPLGGPVDVGSLDSVVLDGDMPIIDGDTPSRDAMGTPQDAESPTADAAIEDQGASLDAAGALDSGTSAMDADTIDADAPRPDASALPADAATELLDMGPLPADAQPAVPDAIPPPRDAGPWPIDAWSPPHDASQPDAAPNAAPDASQTDATLDAAPDAAPDMASAPRCDDGVQNGDETGVDCGGECLACPQRLLEVRPPVYPRALRNPMKGLTTNGVQIHEWASLAHVYIRWNELEDVEADGIDRIRRVTETKFAGVAERNVKVIPRVYLHWSRDDQKYWPSDMRTDDYVSEQFQTRLTRLVGRLGDVWNDDPRIAFIELGIFGRWGEHHSPAPEPAMQALAARLFAEAFPNKHVSVRHAWNQFEGHGFGEYWDSFSHYDQMWPHGQQVRQMNQADQRYRSTYIGGETAYDWGGWEIQPGTTPTDSVRDPVHRNFIINTIRWLHCTQLRWIHAYDVNDQAARAGAEEVHRAMGYRFLLESARFTPEVVEGQLTVSLTIRNVGAAPFYYDWPVQVALVDPETREPVWSATYDGVDIRTWLGGEDWPEPAWSPRDHWSRFSPSNEWSPAVLEWGRPAPEHVIDQDFAVAAPDGTYLLTVAILDPANEAPSLRFATGWYLNGGRHPLGLVTIGADEGGPLPDDFVSDDPWLDGTLNYTQE